MRPAIESGKAGVALPVGGDVAQYGHPERRQTMVSTRSAGALGGGARAFEAYLHVMKSLEAGEHVLVQG